ncbi:DUF3846 domain-containing protein [Pseudoflavonifractor phocaeensis]|nr:DUF3846 domain-containing protein [Pseudoflavonifractor phocaeensis]
MRVLIVEPGRAPYEKEIPSGLAAMQNIVGGLIQALYPFEEPVALICNDEGKLLGLPMNRALRESRTGKPYDIVCGTFLLCGASPDEEDFISLTDEQLRNYKAVFAKPELFLNIGGQLVMISC